MYPLLRYVLLDLITQKVGFSLGLKYAWNKFMALMMGMEVTPQLCRILINRIIPLWLLLLPTIQNDTPISPLRSSSRIQYQLYMRIMIVTIPHSPKSARSH